MKEYTEDTAMTALCIWEAVLEECMGGPMPGDLYQWITNREGVYAGRQAALDLAPMLDVAWESADLDGETFDWEYIHDMLGMMEADHDRPADLTQEMVTGFALEWKEQQGES